MRQLLILTAILFSLFSCSNEENPENINENEVENETDDQSNDDEGTDPDNLISDFEVSQFTFHRGLRLLNWTEATHINNEIISYSIVVENDTIISNISDKLQYPVSCTRFSDGNPKICKVIAKDNLGNSKVREITIENGFGEIVQEVNYDKGINLTHHYSQYNTSDGGTIFAYATYPLGFNDIEVIKYDANFNTQWVYSIPNDQDFSLVSLHFQEINDGFIIAHLSPSGSNLYLYKVNFNGNLVWTKNHILNGTPAITGHQLRGVTYDDSTGKIVIF